MNEDYLNFIKQIYENEEFIYFIESNETNWRIIPNNHKFFKTYDPTELIYKNPNILLDIENKILKDLSVQNYDIILEKNYDN